MTSSALLAHPRQHAAPMPVAQGSRHSAALPPNPKAHAGLWVYVGPSGAGKTSYARHVADYYDATLISQDDFLLAPADRPGDDLHSKYDWRELDLVLADLLDGRRVVYSPFSQVERRREGERVVDPTSLVVVEGITLLLGSVVAQRLAELRVYVDAPPEVRVARQLARLDDEGQYRDTPRDDVERRILAKGRTEDPTIEGQIARCDWLLDTSRRLLVPLPGPRTRHRRARLWRHLQPRRPRPGRAGGRGRHPRDGG